MSSPESSTPEPNPYGDLYDVLAEGYIEDEAAQAQNGEPADDTPPAADPGEQAGDDTDADADEPYLTAFLKRLQDEPPQTDDEFVALRQELRAHVREVEEQVDYEPSSGPIMATRLYDDQGRRLTSEEEREYIQALRLTNPALRQATPDQSTPDADTTPDADDNEQQGPEPSEYLAEFMNRLKTDPPSSKAELAARRQELQNYARYVREQIDYDNGPVYGMILRDSQGRRLTEDEEKAYRTAIEETSSNNSRWWLAPEEVKRYTGVVTATSIENLPTWFRSTLVDWRKDIRMHGPLPVHNDPGLLAALGQAQKDLQTARKESNDAEERAAASRIETLQEQLRNQGRAYQAAIVALEAAREDALAEEDARILPGAQQALRARLQLNAELRRPDLIVDPQTIARYERQRIARDFSDRIPVGAVDRYAASLGIDITPDDEGNVTGPKRRLTWISEPERQTIIAQAYEHFKDTDTPKRLPREESLDYIRRTTRFEDKALAWYRGDIERKLDRHQQAVMARKALKVIKRHDRMPDDWRRRRAELRAEASEARQARIDAYRRGPQATRPNVRTAPQAATDSQPQPPSPSGATAASQTPRTGGRHAAQNTGRSSRGFFSLFRPPSQN